MVTIDSIALTCQMNITNLHSSSIQHHFHRTSTSHPGAPLPVQTMQLRHRAVATWRQALTWPWPQSFPLSLLNERCETNLNTQQVSNKKKKSVGTVKLSMEHIEHKLFVGFSRVFRTCFMLSRTYRMGFCLSQLSHDTSRNRVCC